MMTRVIEGSFAVMLLIGLVSTPYHSLHDAGLRPDNPQQPVRAAKTDSLFYNLRFQREIRQFYEANNGVLLWSFAGASTSQADSVFSVIEHARYRGLLPGQYHLHELRLLRSRRTGVGQLTRMDLLLSDAALSLVADLRGARTQAFAYGASEPAELLHNLSKGDRIENRLAAFEPSFAQYQGLKKSLKVSLDTLDDSLRSRYLVGMDENDSLEQSIRMIEVNMERWRHESFDEATPHILVNIPSFDLRFRQMDSVILYSTIVVGKADSPTPVLSSNIDCIVTYPYWHVPRKIATEEFLPYIIKSKAFLARNHFDVIDRKGNILHPDSVPWNTFSKDYFPVTLRQREGAENALGIIKFSFDNPYAVFLHDTNAKRFFSRSARALSHGCVRVEKAEDLARLLVALYSPRPAKEFERYLREKQKHFISLAPAVPIHIRYFTAFVNEGRTQFYADVYKADQYYRTRMYPQHFDAIVN